MNEIAQIARQHSAAIQADSIKLAHEIIACHWPGFTALRITAVPDHGTVVARACIHFADGRRERFSEIGAAGSVLRSLIDASKWRAGARNGRDASGVSQDMRQPPSPDQMRNACETWNALHPDGTKVRFWMGPLDSGTAREGITTSSAMVLGGHTAGVYVSGGGFVALTHVEAIKD